MTPAELKRCMPRASLQKCADFAAPLSAAMAEYDINSYFRAAHFIAQIGHECGDFVYLAELWGPGQVPEQHSYHDRGGNSKAEAVAIAEEHSMSPGKYWRGHGLIQATFYDMHLWLSGALGVDIRAVVAYLQTPEGACRSACAIWRDEMKLNAVADGGDTDAVCKLITRRINGGYNGLADRLVRLGQCRTAVRHLIAMPDFSDVQAGSSSYLLREG